MKRDKNDQSLQEVLKEWLGNLPNKSKYHQSKLSSIWREKMGESIYHQTDGLQFRNNTLTIKIRSSALRQELFMGRDKILEVLQKAYPEGRIKEIKIL